MITAFTVAGIYARSVKRKVWRFIAYRINNFPPLGNFAPTLPLEPLQATAGKLMVQTCHKVEKSYNLLVNFQLVRTALELKKAVILNLFQDIHYELLSKRSYWKVRRRGAFQYLLFSFFITTDPGLQLSRMTTTTIQKINTLSFPNVVVGNLSFRKRKTTAKTDPRQKPSGMTTTTQAVGSETS